MSGLPASVFGAIQNSDVNKLVVENLLTQMKETAEWVRPNELIEVNAFGAPSRQMVGRKLPFDDSKPRAHAGYTVQHKLDRFASITGSIPDLVGDLTKRAGMELGSVLNGNCTVCSALESKVQAHEDPIMDATAIRFSVMCKFGGAPRCPDKMWGTFEPTPMMTLEDMRRNYMQDFALNDAGNGDLPKFRQEMTSPPPVIKPKEVVKDVDIEIELKKLDESYGIF